MKLTNRSEYALLALIYLARSKTELVPGTEISKAQEIPMRFMQQILLTLKQARIVKSVKGHAGGYALAKNPKKLSLAEIVRLFEGPLASSRSVSQYFYEHTPIEREKKVIKLLKELRDIVSERLENTYLSDML